MIELHPLHLAVADDGGWQVGRVEKGKSTTARYNISGATLANDLGLTDVNKPVDVAA